MKNYIQEGCEVEVTLDGTYSSGDVFRSGSLLVVLSKSGVSGDKVNGSRLGVFTLKKKSTDVDAVGDKLCWNGTNKEFQKATSDLDNAATVTVAAGSGATSVVAVLTPV